MSRNVQCLFIVFILISHACAQVGNSCILKYSGEEGVCKVAFDCPRVEEDAKRGIGPTICGFYQLTTPIVCCESNVFSSSNNFQNTPQLVPNENSFNGENTDTISFPDEGPPSRDQFPSNSISKSEEKCSEYTKTVTSVVQAIPLVTNTEPINIYIDKCEYNSVALIVGGTPASAGEFPFMAALGYFVDGQLEWLCGATLISDRYVLTAAHCTFSRNSNGPEIIRLGELDIGKTDDSEHKDYEIGNIIVHPDYKYPQKYNDIALIQSKLIISFTKYIRPACLYTKTNIEQRTGIATGWGKTDWAASDNSDRLMKVSLNIYDNSHCERTYGVNKNIPRGIDGNMICAGELKGGKDTCQGDSGGPLLITKKENQCKFYVVGVTSFGKSCGQVKTPAVYTKVSEFVPWIEGIIW